MNNPNHTPTFNLKAVVQETGLKPDTLRAWERRYGLPQPDRTSGGHRLYSQRDIDILKWLVVRLEEGLNISRAVELWSTLTESGQDPLNSLEYNPGRSAYAIAAAAPEGEVLTNLRREWVSACMAFDEIKAEEILNQAFALYRVETVCLELLLKGLAQIGVGWFEGEITVQQEHFASELAMRRLETLLTASPAPTRPGRILIGCPPEEDHTFGPLLLTLFLRRRGWNVLYLGADVPVDRLKATINTIKPNLVVLIAQQLITAANLLRMSRVLTAMRVPLAYGGRIFNRLPELRARFPGYFLGERLDEAAPNVEQWLTASNALQPVTEVEPVPELCQQALENYRDKQSVIEADVWHALGEAKLPPSCLNDNNRFLAHSVSAALSLGDLNYLNTDVAWGEKLLYYYSLPPEMLGDYLRIYRHAAEVHLDERGKPILAWLDEQIEAQEEKLN